MDLNLAAPILKPFDLADRPGAPRGATRTALSALDLSGIVYRQAARKDSLPATSIPVNDIPGLAGLNGVADRDPATAQRDALRAQATQLVNQTFFGTMLKQMRDSPFKSELFDGGKGGQAFGQLYDQKLVEHMSRGAGNKLVNAVVRKLEAKRAYAAKGADNRKAGDQGSLPPDANAAAANVAASAGDAARSATSSRRVAAGKRVQG